MLRPNTTFVIGRKGTGKSTVFQRAQHEIRKQKRAVPPGRRRPSVTRAAPRRWRADRPGEPAWCRPRRGRSHAGRGNERSCRHHSCPKRQPARSVPDLAPAYADPPSRRAEVGQDPTYTHYEQKIIGPCEGVKRSRAMRHVRGAGRHRRARPQGCTMQSRQLGQSDPLRPAALPRRQRLRLDDRRERPPSRCSTRSSRPGFDFIDTADVYSRWAPGNQGGESETIIGDWMKARGNRDKVVLATKVGMDMGDGKRGPVAGLHPPGRRGFAAAAPDRPHRPLPGAQGRSGDAAGRDAGGLRRTRHGRQGARHRRLELLAGAAARGARHQPRSRACRATRRCSRNTTSTRAPATRRSWSRSASRADVGVIPLLRAGGGFLTGKYRSEADSRRARAAAQRRSYLNARGLRDPGRAGRGGRAPGRDARPGGAGLADGPAQHHGPDRQRHQRRAGRTSSPPPPPFGSPKRTSANLDPPAA